MEAPYASPDGTDLPDRSVNADGEVTARRCKRCQIADAARAARAKGQFSLSTYLRPFLETVTGLDVNALSMVLLGLGLGGLAGTIVAGFVLRSHLKAALVVLPGVLAVVSVLLIILGHYIVATAALLVLWGLFTAPIPIAWGTWMTRVIPRDLEAGGGLQVALVQVAITLGAFVGGLLFDAAGWRSSFAFAAVLLAAAALLATLVARKAAA